MKDASSKLHTLIGSLKLSLTFWLIAGVAVWLALCVKNGLYTPNGDVIKIFFATLVWYGALGLVLWLPIWVGGKILRALSIFGKSEFRLQLAAHWFIGVLLTYVYLMHRVWFPYTAALSLQGALLTLALILFGLVTGWILVRIASGLSRLTIFKNYWRTGIILAILIVVIYAGSAAYASIRSRFHASVPEELNSAYNTEAKAILIGFDGATWDVINPLMAEGLMPNFSVFLNDAIASPLKSGKPTLSAILWTTIATGKTSRGHGVTEIVSIIAPGLKQNVLNYPHLFGCYIFVQYLMKRGIFYVTPLSSSARHTKAVWNILTDYDERVGVVGWWGSFPPEEINGVVVSDHASITKTEMRQAKGQLSTGEGLPAEMSASPVYPPELMSELAPFAEQAAAMNLEELHYFVAADSADLERVNNLTNWDRSHRESAIKISFLCDKFYRLTTEYLLDTQPFDLLLTYFFETDALGHWMWPYRVAELFKRLPPDEVERFRDVIDSTYVNMDRMLGLLLAHIPEDYNIIIVSDHGFGVEHYGNVVGVGHKRAPDGILIMKGPHFRSSAQFEKPPRLEDLTPTILALLGIPIGEDMAGRVLVEAFEPEFLERYPIRTISSHDRGERFRAQATFSQEDQFLKDKLRALGYIE